MCVCVYMCVYVCIDVRVFVSFQRGGCASNIHVPKFKHWHWTMRYLQNNSTLQHNAIHCNTLQHNAIYCSTLQHNAIHCNTLRHTATNVTHCNTLQHTATYGNTLSHNATQCNTMQHTARYKHKYGNTPYTRQRHWILCRHRPINCLFICATCVIHMCAMPRSYLRCAIMHSTGDMTHSYV